MRRRLLTSWGLAALLVGLLLLVPIAPARLPVARAQVCGSPVYYTDYVICDAPFIYLRLGESSGTVAADASGNGKVGTYTGTYTQGVAGAIAYPADTALGLAGAAAGYVTIPDDPDTNPANAISLETWVYITAFGSLPSAPIEKLSNYRIRINNNGTVTFTVFLCASTTTQCTTGASGRSITSASPISTGAYHHLVGTYATDGTNGALRLYIDGVSAATPITSYNGVLTNRTEAINLGDANAGVTSLNGRIDDVAIYPIALSSAQVAAHYGSIAVTPTPTPTAASATNTPTPTNTFTPAPTSTSTPTPTNTSTPTSTSTPTPTPTPFVRCHLSVTQHEEIPNQGSITGSGVHTLDGCAPGQITIDVGITPTPAP